jgi:nitroreductase
MDFIKLAEERFSVRKFSDRQVEQEKLDLILKAGQVAPTACNNQPQRIYVLQSHEALEKLQKCKKSHFGETLAILICVDTKACWKREYDGKTSGDTDAAIVTTHMMLAAWELGIGSTWVMHFIPEAVRAEFEIPDHEEPISLLVMGYVATDAKPSAFHMKKKDLKEIVTVL